MSRILFSRHHFSTPYICVSLYSLPLKLFFSPASTPPFPPYRRRSSSFSGKRFRAWHPLRPCDPPIKMATSGGQPAGQNERSRVSCAQHAPRHPRRFKAALFLAADISRAALPCPPFAVPCHCSPRGWRVSRYTLDSLPTVMQRGLVTADDEMRLFKYTVPSAFRNWCNSPLRHAATFFFTARRGHFSTI